MAAAADDCWGNPSSVHGPGRAARAHLESARRGVAEAIGAAPADLVLTSGGTEACNLGVLGLARASQGGQVITTAIEHPAVAESVARLETEGHPVLRLPVEAGVPPDPRALAHMLSSNTALVAIQQVNHETGVILPVAEYARVCALAAVPIFVDATQSLGKLPIDVTDLGASALALASHKVGGPAGAGALWVDRRWSLSPQLLGGAQERGRRGGTPAVLSAVGFAAACGELDLRLADQPRLAKLREQLESAMLDQGGVVNGDRGPRTATVTNVSFRGRRGPALVAALDLEGVATSTGAACSSGLNEPSPVLLALHPDESWRAGAALRMSFGPETSESNIEFVIHALTSVLSRPAS